MRRATLSILALALPGLLAACLYEDFHDGAFCSEDGTCPPGQRCSADGFCLNPCPVPDCLGDACGCEPRVADGYQNERRCWADGLCHAMCDHPLTNVARCNSGLWCDPETDECVQTCGSSDDCANGAVCTPSGGSTVCRAP